MKDKVIGVLITFVLAGFIFFSGMDTRVLGDPLEVYQVYLNGEKIGLIDSKDDLLALIDEEQTQTKEKYNVDKVYPPDGLSIEKVYTYDDNIVDANTIYNKIKDIEPFTISGYIVTINYAGAEGSIVNRSEGEESKTIYILNKNDIYNSLHDVAAAFIGEDEIKNYQNNTQVKITDTGENLTSIYFEESISVKEALISTRDKIITNESDLTQYLMFGTTDTQDTYTVKDGEDLQTIADEHNLNIKELLIANPKYSSSKVLLTAGEIVNVGLINPLISVSYYKTVVEDMTVQYQTDYTYDASQYSDYQATTTAGQNGITRVTENVKYTNGAIQSLFVTNKNVLVESINEVVTKGTKSYSGGTYNTGYNNTYNPGKLNWYWPTTTPYMIMSGFEWRWGSHHDGIDISGCGSGSPIYSSTNGVVVDSNTGCANKGWPGSQCGGEFGNYVKILTTDGTYNIIYGHMLQNIEVSTGDTVTRGQLIGHMGSSGSSTGTHLHFEIDLVSSGQAINPCKVLTC